MAVVDGTTVRVSVAGSGPPLLLLPGIGTSTGSWGPLRDQLAARTTIAFDLPGIGGSPADHQLWTVGRTARLAASLLDRFTRAGSLVPDVLGYSLGGLVAQHLARLLPVRRLVLVATTAGQPAIPPLPHRLLAMLRGGLLLQGGGDGRGDAVGGDPSAARHHELRELGALMGGRVAREPAALAEAVALLTASPPSAAGYYGQALAASVWTGLTHARGLRLPVLVLAGSDDRLVPVVNSRLLASLLPNASLQILPGAGHLLVLDDARRVGAAVREFLD